MAIEPADETLRVLAEVIVCIEALVGLLDPKQLFHFRAERIEDGLPIRLGVDKEVSPELRHHRRHLDGVRMWQGCFLVKPEARQFA